jgi:pyruvate dehydrogenase E1 component alpha subunit
MGHSMSDAVAGTYRSRAELDEQLKRDPIALLRSYMHERNEISESEVAEMDAAVRAECEDAWQFADQSPEPDLAALMQNVTIEGDTDPAVGDGTSSADNGNGASGAAPAAEPSS